MKGNDIASLRKEYTQKQLWEKDVQTNPVKQFEIWLNEAISANIPEPNATILATSSFDGKPSARVILLKKYDETGFSFFTNYDSRKARQLLQNPFGAMVFFWSELERQVRIEGEITKVSERESDLYFHNRPQGSKIGAWASPQSKVIPSRRYLESLKTDFQEEFGHREIKRPSNWGGYTLDPVLFEFWQGRPDRLHDRIQYTMVNGNWKIERLAP